MRRATFTLLLEAVVLCYSLLPVTERVNVTMLPARDLIIVPSQTNTLLPGLPLSCRLEPDTLEPNVNYTTRWIVPGGQIINSTEERFLFSESMVSIDGRQLPGTILVVINIFYQDAGTYICEGRSTAPGASIQWASANIEVQLNLELLSNSSTVTVVSTMDDLSTVALYCEMRAFIRPDSSLIWEGPGGRRITDEMEKYEITFSDGSPEAAANGRISLVPSRVSTLTITNLEPSDAGTYTCSVTGTTEAVTMELIVNGTNRVDIVNTSTTNTTQTTSTTSVNNNTSTTNITQTTSTTSVDNNTTDTIQLTVIILSSLIAILTGLLVITVIAIFLCLVHARNKLRISNTSDTSNPAVVLYDYIWNHNHSAHHNEVQPGELDSAASTRTESDTSVIIEGTYDEINDDRNASAARDTIKDINDSTTTEENVDHGMALSAVASETNRACGIATTDQIGVSESSANHGMGTDGIYSYNYLTIDADVPDSMTGQEKNETYYGAYGVATDDFHTLESNISHDEAKSNVADADMENNEAYGMADAIVENNEAYGVATDGIGIDIMERNIAAYGTAVIHADTAGDTHVMVDDGDSELEAVYNNII